MENDKNLDFEDDSSQKETEFSNESSSRARNRTVMLTPEITGQVRARIAQELEQGYTSPGAKPSAAFEAAGSPLPSSTYVPAGPPRGAPDAGDFKPVSAAVGAVAPSAAAGKQGIAWHKETPVVGFLVSFDANPNGDVYELRTGRVMITSQAAPGSNCLVIKDDSVSPMHAIMRVSAGGEIQVLDQLSEFGTKIQRFGSTEEEQLSGDKGSVEHGDIIKFGNRKFHVCVIAVSEGA